MLQHSISVLGFKFHGQNFRDLNTLKNNKKFKANIKTINVTNFLTDPQNIPAKFQAAFVNDR